mmetsp:Transcript_18253/g.18320  ORF Transcript_18253/g.18320 Transcript_18253/m.18320 type:complete len:142 (-) Transcript_18253:421-846(-)
MNQIMKEYPDNEIAHSSKVYNIMGHTFRVSLSVQTTPTGLRHKEVLPRDTISVSRSNSDILSNFSSFSSADVDSVTDVSLRKDEIKDEESLKAQRIENLLEDDSLCKKRPSPSAHEESQTNDCNDFQQEKCLRLELDCVRP